MPELTLAGAQLACGGAPALQNAQAMTSPRSKRHSSDDFESQLRPLWVSAQEGDETAYRAALERMAVRLRAYLRRRMQTCPDEVEDLVQETLLALHLQRGTWDSSLPVSAWMIAIARHKLIDMWRRHGRKMADVASIDDLEEHETPTSVDCADEHNSRHDLAVLLSAIPASQREAIVLTKIQGLSVAEVSASTGLSMGAVRVQVHRGLRKLVELVRRSP
jgi:RNA polymerase sigma-70 factor (ECF subfamily)